MKAIALELSAVGTIALTEKELSILSHIAGCDTRALAEYLVNHVSGVYTDEEYCAVLKAMGEATEALMASAKAARGYVFDERYGNKSGGLRAKAEGRDHEVLGYQKRPVKASHANIDGNFVLIDPTKDEDGFPND